MIQVKQFEKDFGYTVYTMTNAESTVQDGYTSDLLSDVMGNAEEGSALITIQAHKNTIAVATLIGLPVIILCNNRIPTDDMVSSAEAENVAVVGTHENQFTVSYRLAKALGKI